MTPMTATEYVRHEGRCKSCGRPIWVKVHPSYSELGDPLALLPLAACDRCADHRVAVRSVTESIIDVLVTWRAKRAGKSPDKRTAAEVEARTALTSLTQHYASLVAQHLGARMVWDEEFVHLLLEHPGKVTQILGDYQRLLTQ